MSPVIRIDPHVKAELDRLRLPDERNYSLVIMRLARVYDAAVASMNKLPEGMTPQEYIWEQTGGPC